MAIFGWDALSFFLGALVLLFFWKIGQSKGKNSGLHKLPGPTAYPILGNVVEMLEPPDKRIESIKERHRKFGSLFCLWAGSRPIIISSNPEYIEVLLKSSRHSQKASSYDFLHPWLGMGLLTSHGNKWAVHRKLITPTFHFKVLQSFVDVFHENAAILAEKLNKKADEAEEFDVYSLITLCTLDIICETAMGTKVNAQSESHNQYVRSVYRLSELITYRISRIWLYYSLFFEMSSKGKEFRKHLDTVHGFSNKVIKSRQEALKGKRTSQVADNEDQKKLTFLDLLLESSMESGEPLLTDKELREEVDTFMFEGHDTTSAALSWALSLLGHHPQTQEDCYEELKAIFQDDPNRTPTIADLAEMKLLERVIKEALRLYPSVFSIGRVVEEDLQFGEYLIPKGTDTVINIYALHINPKYYPDPEKFDPDRFLPENNLKRHPYSYLPFSAGPRNCIGQKFALYEEKVVLSSLIRKFRFQTMEPPEKIVKTPELVLKPKYGIKMKVSKRSLHDLGVKKVNGFPLPFFRNLSQTVIGRSGDRTRSPPPSPPAPLHLLREECNDGVTALCGCPTNKEWLLKILMETECYTTN